MPRENTEMKENVSNSCLVAALRFTCKANWRIDQMVSENVPQHERHKVIYLDGFINLERCNGNENLW